MSARYASGVNQRNPTPRPACERCGHPARLHHVEGCGALLLEAQSRASCVCACTVTQRALIAGSAEPPAELLERKAVG
jgi:hypothetical protein